MEWVDRAQDRDRSLAPVNAEMTLGVLHWLINCQLLNNASTR
jgi:hypothetical protein